MALNAKEWVSQAEAARLRGVSRQAISKLAKKGKLRTLLIGGRTLVKLSDVTNFRPGAAGRPGARTKFDDLSRTN